MNTLIIYATKHGCTKECATMLASFIKEKTHVSNIKEAKQIDLSHYSHVVLGSSIYYGKMQKKLIKFAKKYQHDLENKKIGVFVCDMNHKDIHSLIQNNFPSNLIHAIQLEKSFGGKFDFNKLSNFEKFVVKKVSNVHDHVTTVNKDAIQQFAIAMNNL